MKGINDDLEKFIIKEYLNGGSGIRIAKVLDVCPNSVYKILKNNNIEIRNDVDKSKIYSFNENYFKTINSEEKSYWLGFLMADGYITSKQKHCNRRIGLCLSERDICHIEKFKKAIGATNPIFTYENSTYKTRLSKITLASETMCEDLLKYGMTEHKSLTLQFPKNIDKEYIRHFIRGYFDGDGSLKRKGRNTIGYTFSLLGTYEFLSEFKRIYELPYNLRKCNKNNDSNNYDICFTKRIYMEYVLDDLYNNSNIYLERKFKRYLEQKEIWQNKI